MPPLRLFWGRRKTSVQACTQASMQPGLLTIYVLFWHVDWLTWQAAIDKKWNWKANELNSPRANLRKPRWPENEHTNKESRGWKNKWVCLWNLKIGDSFVKCPAVTEDVWQSTKISEVPKTSENFYYPFKFFEKFRLRWLLEYSVKCQKLWDMFSSRVFSLIMRSNQNVPTPPPPPSPTKWCCFSYSSYNDLWSGTALRRWRGIVRIFQWIRRRRENIYVPTARLL